MNIISFVCLLFVCLSVLLQNFFTFNMNVSECTPQSVGDIFWPRKKGLFVYIYWIVFFIKRKKWSHASKCTLAVFFHVNPRWSLNRKDGADRVRTLEDGWSSHHHRHRKWYRFCSLHVRPLSCRTLLPTVSSLSAALYVSPNSDLCIPLLRICTSIFLFIFVSRHPLYFCDFLKISIVHVAMERCFNLCEL